MSRGAQSRTEGRQQRTAQSVKSELASPVEPHDGRGVRAGVVQLDFCGTQLLIFAVVTVLLSVTHLGLRHALSQRTKCQ